MNTDTTFRLRSGHLMPVMGLGTWQLVDNTADAVSHAIDLGYRMIDTSGDYGTQPGVGEAIRGTSVARDDLYLVTKVEEHEDSLESSAENMRELGLDHTDLMLVHRPPRTGAGEDLWKGLMTARDQGLTVDIGVSNYSIPQMEQLAAATGELPVVNQIEWSPFGWSQEMKTFCDQNEIVIQAYSPLTRERRLDDERLKQIADPEEITPAQLMLAWGIHHGVAPLPKANQAPHQEENLTALDIELDSETMAQLDDLNEQYSALGSLAYV